MTQDLQHRISIVVNRELPTWQVLNSVAHISAYFGSHLHDRFISSNAFETMDGAKFPRNSQFSIIVLATNQDRLPALRSSALDNPDLMTMSFIRDMIENNVDDDIVAKLSAKSVGDVELLGVGLFGSHEKVKTLTKRFKLWA